jgi:hypothetical protein
VPGAGDSGEETGGAKGPSEGHEQPRRRSGALENGPERIQEFRHFNATEDQLKRQGSPSGDGRRDGLNRLNLALFMAILKNIGMGRPGSPSRTDWENTV